MIGLGSVSEDYCIVKDKRVEISKECEGNERKWLEISLRLMSRAWLVAKRTFASPSLYSSPYFV
jgi:hypothetical protein